MDRPTETVDVESSESEEDRLVIVENEEHQPETVRPSAYLERWDGQTWLNDEVVDHMVEIINKRFSEVKGVSSYFFDHITRMGSSAMNSSWSRKIDFLRYTNIFIPINIENKHWVLAVVTPCNKTATIYDPLKVKYASVELVLVKYFSNRYGGIWTTAYNVSIPSQENAYDCGVFMVAFMWNIAEDKPNDFKQSNMVYLREKFKRMMVEDS